MPTFLNRSLNIVQNEPFTLKFSGCDGGCTLTLLNCPSTDLREVKVLSSDISGESYTFTLSGLPADTYGFKLEDNDSGDITYIMQSELEDDDSEVAARAEGPVTAEVDVSESSTTSASTRETTSSIESTSPIEVVVTAEIAATPADPNPTPSSLKTSENSTSISSSDQSDSTEALSTSTSTPSHGLSPGALAGIVVGVVGVVLLVLAGLFLFWRRKKKQRKLRGSTSTPEMGDQNPQISELEQPKGIKPSVMPTSPAELRGTTPRPPAAELAGRARPAELLTTEIDAKKELEGDLGVVVSELHGDGKSPHSELHAETAKYEMDSTQQPAKPPLVVQTQAAHPIPQREQAGHHSPSLSTISPDTQVSILPEALGETASSSIIDTASLPSLSSTTDNAQTRSALMDQYAQLESRRQRILQLQQIEEEQADLQQKLSKLQENNG
ncbi:hypothetical protein B0T10DRAFT_603498 [Thelonectria olida]|uniref:Yeast cell wall synthesis Kre9/Knh1-like N-terminal domain-containing protein n=1 Tax=Thelonectria olida TaxID=1576542 RepID=A0A9P8WG87_9HYPO|nr:hypothetical protein B0T10DRAFT_603498 [Thelonectria olida]